MVLADGTSTLNISAEPSAPPQTNVDEEMVEKIKVAMSDRYVPENKGMKTVLLCKQWLLSYHYILIYFNTYLSCLFFSTQSQSVSCRSKIPGRVLLCTITQVSSYEKSY